MPRSALQQSLRSDRTAGIWRGRAGRWGRCYLSQRTQDDHSASAPSKPAKEHPSLVCPHPALNTTGSVCPHSPDLSHQQALHTAFNSPTTPGARGCTLRPCPSPPLCQLPPAHAMLPEAFPQACPLLPQ